MRQRLLASIGVVAVITVVALASAAGPTSLLSFVRVAEAASGEGAQAPTTAKQEGKVAIYTNPLAGPLHPTLKSAFEKQYPGITVEWVTATPSETVSKFLNEYEKGVRSADVIVLGLAGLFDILEKPGSLAKYAPKDTAGFPVTSRTRTEGGHHTSIRSR